MRITYTRGTQFHTDTVEPANVGAFTRRLRQDGCQITRLVR